MSLQSSRSGEDARTASSKPCAKASTGATLEEGLSSAINQFYKPFDYGFL